MKMKLWVKEGFDPRHQISLWIRLLLMSVESKTRASVITVAILVSILYKSRAGRYRPVSVADGPITARYIFLKNASWDATDKGFSGVHSQCGLTV